MRLDKFNPWLQRDMWSTMVTLNQIVLVDTMLGSRYEVKTLVKTYSDFTNATTCHQWDHLCPYVTDRIIFNQLDHLKLPFRDPKM